EEYASGHLAGARSAPGGQLVQATDVYMATRNARIVLVDDDGVRAVMTGSWLAQMGWPEVHVLDGGLAARELVQGMPTRVIAELGDCGFPDLRVLDGGTAAWRAAGLPLATGREAMADTPNDCWRRPYDPYAAPDARERYLKWEIELVRQIEHEGDIGFRVAG